MKESITKFDLESAFKALDEIGVPKVGKVRANKPALTEIFSRKSKFDALFEEYYDIGSNTGLEDAKEARDAEIAQAKLARIEKIVDLDADSAEDLLTSYVGKLIIQCPQCMTLFYKDEEDVVASEEDPSTINVNEVCQHCGNENGYSLIGKVGEAEPDVTEEPIPEDIPEEDLDFNIEDEEPTEETSEEDLNFDDELEELDLNIEEEPAEEEKKEESFTATEGQPLNEELIDDKELDDKLEAHNEYIEYLRAAIAQEEEKLEKANNEQVKVAIQRNIDAFKSDLEKALPEAVKNDIANEEVAAEDLGGGGGEEPVEGVGDERVEETSEDIAESLTEALCEDNDVTDAEFDQLMNSSEFKKPISDVAVRAMLAMEDEVGEEAHVKESVSTYYCDNCGYEVELDDEDYEGICPRCMEHHGDFNKLEENLDNIFSAVEELEEDVLECMISDSLVEMYGNVAGFRLKDCSCNDNKLMVEGIIHFTSGNTRNTTYTFNEAFVKADKITLRGLNEKLGLDKQFQVVGRTENKTFITESLKVLKNN